MAAKGVAFPTVAPTAAHVGSNAAARKPVELPSPDVVFDSFTKAWQHIAMAPTTMFSMLLQAEGQREELQVPRDALNCTSQALTIRFDITKQKIIHLPLDEVNIIMRTPAIRNTANATTLFPTEKIWGGTDRTGRIKIIMEQLDATKLADTYRLKTIIFLVHGQSILEHCGGRSLNEQRIDNAPLPFGHGLVRFAVYVTLRWEDKSKAILLPHHKALCVHSSIMMQSINQAESPFDCTVSMKLTSFPVPVPYQIAYNTRDCDPSRLIADVMMITERGDVFWYRSAYLWLQRYTNFPMFFEGNMLASDGFWVTFSFKNISSEVTKIDSCKIYIPLGRINTFFKTRYKWLDIACEFLPNVKTTPSQS